MGFQRRNYRLIWPQEHELHGLEVVTRGLSIGELEKVAGLAPATGGRSRAEDLDPLLELFAGALISWNLEDEGGEPVGTTLADLRDQDARFLMAVVMTWVQEVSSVPDPLPRSSAAGAPTAPPAGIPMEIR